jgi:hypothetical protein
MRPADVWLIATPDGALAEAAAAVARRPAARPGLALQRLLPAAVLAPLQQPAGRWPAPTRR